MTARRRAWAGRSNSSSAGTNFACRGPFSLSVTRALVQAIAEREMQLLPPAAQYAFGDTRTSSGAATCTSIGMATVQGNFRPRGRGFPASRASTFAAERLEPRAMP